MGTLFFSWQSDLDKRTNRNFIHRCLEKAAAQLNSEPEVEDAPRDAIVVDQDTQGVMGHPDIVQTILSKIDACEVFIPDFSLVGSTENGKKCPNPNVMIEYGYALKSLGFEKILPIMNTAYGSFEDLPFDLRNKRAPLGFHLEAGASDEAIKQQRDALTQSLVKILKSSLNKPKLVEVKVNPENLYYKHVASIDSKTTMSLRDENGGYIPSSGMFVLITPSGTWSPSNVVFSDTVRKGLRPLGRWQSSSLHRWPDSMEVYEVVLGKENDRDRPRMRFTHLSSDGLLLAFDRFRQDEETNKKYECRGVVPSTYIEQQLTSGLKSFLHFYKEYTSYVPPFNILVGLHNISDFKLAVPPGYFNKVSEEPYLKGRVMTLFESVSFETDIEALLQPFFAKVWDEVCMERPKTEA